MERSRIIGVVGSKNRCRGVSVGQVFQNNLLLMFAVSAMLLVASNQDNHENEEILELVTAVSEGHVHNVSTDRTVRSIRGSCRVSP